MWQIIKAHSFQEKRCSQESNRSLTRTTVCSWQNLSKIQFHMVFQSSQNVCSGRKKNKVTSRAKKHIYAVLNSNSFAHEKIIKAFFMCVFQKFNSILEMMETSAAGDMPWYLYGKFTKEKEHCIKNNRYCLVRCQREKKREQELGQRERKGKCMHTPLTDTVTWCFSSVLLL